VPSSGTRPSSAEVVAHGGSIRWHRRFGRGRRAGEPKKRSSIQLPNSSSFGGKEPHGAAGGLGLLYGNCNTTFVCHRKAWHNLTSSDTLGRRSSRAMAAFASSISSSLAASSARIKLAPLPATPNDFFARISRICTRQFLRENFPEISLTSDSSELRSALPCCGQAESLFSHNPSGQRSSAPAQAESTVVRLAVGVHPDRSSACGRLFNFALGGPS